MQFVGHAHSYNNAWVRNIPCTNIIIINDIAWAIISESMDLC